MFRVADGKNLFQTDLQVGVAAPITFSDDDRRFIVANTDTRARVWDLDSCSPAGPFLPHPAYCRFGKLNSDGTLAVTLAADRKLRIWDAEKGDLLISTVFDLNRNTIWFSKDSTRIIDRKSDGTITKLILPTLRSSREQMQTIVELQCGEAIDETGGTSEVMADKFHCDPKRYIEAWRSLQTR